MKTAIIIPDRGDRPEFLNNCLRMMRKQTMPPDHIEIVADPPLSSEKDITWRYRTGYERLRGKGFDCILFIENDDWYAPNYIEFMVKRWMHHDMPDLFGTAYTVYYHLKERGYFTMNHPERASAMNTLLKPDLNFSWCADNDPYTDLHLWLHTGLNGKIVHPVNPIAIGIKHGVGLCGGVNHVDKLHRFTNKDEKFVYLHKHMIQEHDDFESFNFYTQYYNEN